MLSNSKFLVNVICRNLTGVRSFSASSLVKSNIFNVQDEDDFNAKVLNSKQPVIVDFHAGFV